MQSFLKHVGKSPARRRGVAAYYLVVAMVVLCGFCSFGVDLGRVQLVKTELRRAADASARAGALSLLDDVDDARAEARKIARLNKADGQPVELDSNDVQFGKWDLKSKKPGEFTAAGTSNPNAVRVVARRTGKAGNAVPLVFGKIIGHASCDVTAESVAMLIPPVNVDEAIPATANPFLAGMPPGAVASLNNPHNSPDFAGTASNPRQSPQAVKHLPLVEGEVLTFDSIDGTARHDPNLAMFNPDGETSNVGRNTNGAENGISDLRAPINALVGVFLSDEQPNVTSPPPSLDFGSAASREFTGLEPQLKQLFFIGDGKNRDGIAQEFKVPKGATRLYLATWDFYEWNNNGGVREVKITRPARVITVK